MSFFAGMVMGALVVVLLAGGTVAVIWWAARSELDRDDDGPGDGGW